MKDRPGLSMRTHAASSAEPIVPWARLACALAMVWGALLLPQASRAAGLIGARAASHGATPVAAEAVHFESLGDGARLVFDVTGPLDAHAFPLANPDRIIVDLPEITFHIDPATGRPLAGRKTKPGEAQAAPSGLIASYRFGQFAPGRSRIIIDLTKPARIVRVEMQPAGETGAGHLIIELASTDRQSFAAAASAASTFGLTAKRVPTLTRSTPAASPKPVIVLDAGHGGIDFGALSAHGDIEKTVVLEFARALAARLEAQGRYKVVLTRNSDVFIPLGERVQIAREANAALFVSIHADTLREGHVQGATVYTVSERASDAEAARLADKENRSDDIAGIVGSDDVAEVHDILQDLTRRETRAYSHVFARTLVSLWKNAGQLNKNPQRSAGFKVLKALDVPSVLLELGYLSSAKDLAALTSPTWREKAASTVAGAIDAFFAQRTVETATVGTGAVARDPLGKGPASEPPAARAP
ncbi:MAG: N-acetylmuramoyl-L-alanine amidase [Beijerinckiaceae bacterium]